MVWEDRRLGRRELLFWTLWLAAGLCYLGRGPCPGWRSPTSPCAICFCHHRPHVPGGLRLL